ncbi:MAG: HlyD family efflux transporter periplasmic adaptor subunit [Alphaproteobacteria bacterium]|nr:HlyD family efflux transporter periplasmic adaptor subunit [Alphaproteobacteria bacterium]
MTFWLALLAACSFDDATPAYTGTIEVTEVEVAATLGGRLVEVLPHEGDALKVGDPVFRLDTTLLEAERTVRAASVEQAHAAREAASAQVRAADAQVATLQREVERVRKLQSSGVGTAQQLSQLSGQLDVARAQASAARELVAQAEAGIRQAEAAVAAADTHLQEGFVKAAVAGVVLSRNREPGEIVGPGTSVVTLGDLQHPRLRIYVPLLDVERLELGDTVRVKLDGVDEKSGRIERIAGEAEFAPREILTPDERVKRVFAVDIALEPGPGIHPGMPADAYLAQ